MVAPVITGVTFVFTSHVLYFHSQIYNLASSFLVIFLFSEIASVNIYGSRLLPCIFMNKKHMLILLLLSSLFRLWIFLQMTVAVPASARPLSGLVAPLSGQSLGLQRAQVTHGVREVSS